MPERDYNYGDVQTFTADNPPDFAFEPGVLKVITMDDPSDQYFNPVGLAMAYSVDTVKLDEQEGSRTHPGERWQLMYPEYRTATKDLLAKVHGIHEGVIITDSLFVLRELDLRNLPQTLYYNLNKGVWRVSRDIDQVGDIEILEREIEQSERYLSAAAEAHRQALSSSALADTGLTAEIPTVFRDSLPSSVH